VSYCHLESWYQSDGATRHQASYQLQTSGLGRLRLTLPPGVADIRSVSIDGEPVAWHVAAVGEESRLTVDLPAAQKFPCVSVQWTATEPPLQTIGSLTPRLPEPELPVLARYWTAWLPPGYDRRDQAAEASGDRPGWSVCRAELATEEPPLLKYVHRASVRLWGFIALLAVAAACCLPIVDRPARLVSLLGGFAVAVALVPDSYIPIALGGALAIILHLAWRWIQPRGSPPASLPTTSGPAANPAMGSTVSRAAQLGLVLLGVLIALPTGGVARGETPQERGNGNPPNSPPRQNSPAYRVFVPIDAEKKPSGGKVYLPEPFYQELYRRGAASVEKPQGWLILRATYRGALAAEGVSGRLAVDTLRVQYDLQVFGHGTRVRIPLFAEGARQLPNDVSLDGRTIDAQWEPEAREKPERSILWETPEGPFRQIGPAVSSPPSLAFDVSEPGEYRLEMSLRPMVHNASGLDVSIPRVPRSRLELSLPDGAPLVEVPSAAGAVRLEKGPSRLAADLGPADRLTVRWRERAASATVGPAIDAEQFLWLKVQPGSVVLNAKFKLHAAEGQIQEVQLAVDPRLRLLPLSGDDPPTVQAGPESDQSRLFSFRWQRPAAEQTTLEVTFLLSGATGVGNFRLPRVELLDARTTKRCMAVGVDPALDCEQQQSGQIEKLTVSDFLRAWGATDSKPYAAYRLPAGEIDWAISTRPHEPRSDADQILSLSYDEDRVDLLLEAKIATTSGYVFQHRIAAPPELKIESISLLEGDVERAGRWSRDADGTVTVFLNGAASGQQRLVLRGRLPIESGKAEPLPLVRPERCRLRESTIRLYRRPTVLLSIHGNRNRVGAGQPLSEAVQPELGRFVEAISWKGPRQPSVAVTVEPNRSTTPSQINGHPERSEGSGPNARRSFAALRMTVIDSPTSTVKSEGAPQRQGLSGSHASFVRLADVTIAWQADGNLHGTAVFDIEPADAVECPLHLPDGYELLRVSVEGIPVTPTPERGDGNWRFALVSQRLPQRVEVTFRGDCRKFESPALGGWPVRHTLWTVIGPLAWEANGPEGLPAVDAWRQELVRLKSAAASVQSAAKAASDDAVETSRWYPAWAHRIAAARLALQRELATADADSEATAAKRDADAIGRQIADLTARLGEKRADAADSANSPAISPSPLPTVRCSVEGRVQSLSLDCRQIQEDRSYSRLWTAAGLVALTCLAVVVLVRGRFSLHS
jgi:hypothetical protein